MGFTDREKRFLILMLTRFHNVHFLGQEQTLHVSAAQYAKMNVQYYSFYNEEARAYEKMEYDEFYEEKNYLRFERRRQAYGQRLQEEEHSLYRFLCGMKTKGKIAIRINDNDPEGLISEYWSAKRYFPDVDYVRGWPVSNTQLKDIEAKTLKVAQYVAKLDLLNSVKLKIDEVGIFSSHPLILKEHSRDIYNEMWADEANHSKTADALADEAKEKYWIRGKPNTSTNRKLLRDAVKKGFERRIAESRKK